MRLLAKYFILTIVTVFLAACGKEVASLSPLPKDAVILAFGDSLTYGSGANIDTQSYPAVLEKLTQRQVINAGIPGEISRDGLARLPDLLTQHQPDLVIICHGGNDILRRMNKTALEENLSKMVSLAHQQGVEVLLIGVPEFNFGFTVPELYDKVAQSQTVPIELNVLAEIEGDNRLKSDRVHPNAAGYQQMAEKIALILQKAGAL